MTVSNETQTQANKLRNASVWNELWEIRVDDTETLRITGTSSTSVTFNSVEYLPFPMQRLSIERDQDGNFSGLSVRVSAIDLFVVAKLEADKFRGKVAILRIINDATTESDSNAIVERFIIKAADVDETWVEFTLGQDNILSRSHPPNRFERTRCRFGYGSTQCGYDTTRSGAIATCDHTLSGANGCTVHGNDEVAAGLPRHHPLRFGGFPSIMKGPYA